MFQYQAIVVEEDLDNITETLNDWAKDGWELVTATEITYEQSNGLDYQSSRKFVTTLYLKKQTVDIPSSFNPK